MNTFEPIIGLEIHIELATKSKMFCGCPADWFGKEPNTNVCSVCLGLPGALPVPNKKAVEWAILLGLALGCEIPEVSKFDRKNYFYPDLPKGYQISQYDQPIAIEGKLVILSDPPAGGESRNLSRMRVLRQAERSLGYARDDKKVIRIRRVHIEEDTGKLQHAVVDGKHVSLVDFNRSGVPLVEIVTEPDFRTVEEVDVFVKKIQQIVRYLGISGADMEKGSMRIEPSISMRKSKISFRKDSGQSNLNDQHVSSRLANARSNNTYTSINVEKIPDYRVEIKNINSFKFVRNAIDFEITRQTELLQQGETPAQQTRGWNEAKRATIAQRGKEEAHDYRYFPEPDIPPMRWEQLTINNLQSTIPELPDAKKARFLKDFGLNDYDAEQLTETRERAEYFEEAVSCQLSAVSYKDITPKMIANWIINKKINFNGISPEELLHRITASMQTPEMSNEEMEKIIRQVLAENPKAIDDYKKGKEQALGFLIGQLMRMMKGKISVDDINSRIKTMIRQMKEKSV